MQSSIKNKYILKIVLVFFCLISAFVGLGFSYLKTVEKTLKPGFIAGWSKDGWIEETFNLSFKDIASKGNRLILTFEKNKLIQKDLQFEKLVCGVKNQDILIAPDSEKLQVSIGGDCNPRDIVFKGKQTVSGSKDNRKLVAKLKDITIKSKVFFPLVSAKILGIATLILVLFVLIAFKIFETSKYRSILIVIPFLFIPLLASSEVKDWSNLLILSVVTLSILAGYAFCKVNSDNAEGRERDLQSYWFYFIAVMITLLGLGIRYYGLNFGLPGKYHTDETPKVNAINRMIQTGTLNPKYFLHPSILLYSTYFTSKILNFLGLESAFTPAGNFDSLLRFSGRLVSATAGGASVFLTFLIGKRIYTPFVGLLSAFMLAVFPLHVTCSRYLKEDALLTFWVLLVVYTVLLAVDASKKTLEGKISSKEILLIALAFIFAGFSASTKYSGILSIVIVFALPWLSSNITSLKTLDFKAFIPNLRVLKIVLLFSPLVVVAFIIGTPYSVLDFELFAKGFNSERSHMIRGHIIPITAWSQYWMYHISRSIMPGSSAFVTILAFIGVGISIYRRRFSDLYILGLFLLFYLPAEYVKAKPAPQPERYILPCLPFLAILAAESVHVFANTKLRKLVPIISILLIVLPAIKTFQYATEIYNDTRVEMSEWMIKNVPLGSKVLVDWTPYSAFFFNNEFQIGTFPPGKMVLYLAKERLKESGYDYLLLSSLSYDRYFSQPEAEPARRGIMRKVFKQFKILKTVESKYGTYGFHNPKLVLFSIKDTK